MISYNLRIKLKSGLEKGNTVGSLSEKQKSLIEGCLLGDGYMRCKTNAHLQITHSINQKDYVDWKYLNLSEFVLTPPKSYKGNGKRIGYRFFTRSLPLFTSFYYRFYKDNKIIPEDIKLTDLTLAVWYMDDGSKSGQSCYLNTQKFIFEDQEKLINILHGKYNLRANRDRDKQYFRLRFNFEDSRKFVRIIEPYVLPSMRYKLPI